MRVLMLVRGYPPFVIGGIGRHNFELLHGLQRAGIEVAAATIPAQRYEPLPGKVKVYREVGNDPDVGESGGSVPAAVRKSTASFVRTAIRAAALEGKPDLGPREPHHGAEPGAIRPRATKRPHDVFGPDTAGIRRGAFAHRRGDLVVGVRHRATGDADVYVQKKLSISRYLKNRAAPENRQT